MSDAITSNDVLNARTNISVLTVSREEAGYVDHQVVH
jgi:hypothetical protein